jgi:hypothetical protein
LRALQEDDETPVLGRLKAYHSSLIDQDSDLPMVGRTPEQPNVRSPLLDPQAVVEPSSGVLPVALLPSEVHSDSSHVPPISRSHVFLFQDFGSFRLFQFFGISPFSLTVTNPSIMSVLISSLLF